VFLYNKLACGQFRKRITPKSKKLLMYSKIVLDNSDRILSLIIMLIQQEWRF